MRGDYTRACIIPIMCSQPRVTFSFFLFTLLLSCNPQPSRPSLPTQATLVIYRLNPPAFLEFSKDLKVIREIPFSLPPNCGLLTLFSPSLGKFIAIELSCPNGQTVLFLDTDAGHY